MMLVNGAAGFLGSTVVETLCSRGIEVRATDLPGTDLGPARRAEAHVVEADLLDKSSLPKLMHGVKSVVNVAGMFNYSLPWDVLYKANVVVTRNMCEASLQAGVTRFVHISSIAAYGKPETRPVTEDQPLNPKSNYERSKKLSEDEVFLHARKGLPAVVIRPAGIYGPRSKYGQAAFMALLALARELGVRRIPVIKGGPLMHHVHVEDVAGAIDAVLGAPFEQAKAKAVNVADDNPITQGELFEAIMPRLKMERLFSLPYFTRMNWPFIKALAFMPEPVFTLFNNALKKRWERVIESQGLRKELCPRLDRGFLDYMSGDYVLDNTRLKSLGYRLKHPDARQGIKESVRWYQDQGWLPRYG